MPRPMSGSRLAPKMMRMMNRMMISSGTPNRPMVELLRVVAIFALIVPLIPNASLSGQFASGVSLVEVYATVTDRDGQPITGLTAADFDVTEDERPQKVSAFAA